MQITITIPGTPAGKGRGRAAVVNGHAHVFTPAKTRTREGIVASLGADVMAGRPPLEGPLVMTVHAVMPVAASWSKKKKAAALANTIRPTGRPDCDNVLKLIEDGLNGITYRDDSQIVSLHITKTYGEVPRTVVAISEIEP